MRKGMKIYLAAEDCAALYREDGLDDADRRRLADFPHLSGRAEWRVSRVLKQAAAGAGKLCLSHSGGCAAGLVCGMRSGIDLERLRPRDFSAWPHWVLSVEESCWLSEQGGTVFAHYALWTVKEALAKAADLSFADLPALGLARRNGRRVLQAQGECWQGCVWRAGGFALACVWPCGVRPQWQWRMLGGWRGVPIPVYGWTEAGFQD